MIKILAPLSLALLTGCVATLSGMKTIETDNYGPAVYTDNSSSCPYQSITGNEYIVTDSFKYEYSSIFYFDGYMFDPAQNRKSNYTSLELQPFKVVETGLNTGFIRQTNSSYKGEERIILNDNIYTRNQNLSSKIITKDCSIYYINGKKPIEKIKEGIAHSDGSNLSDTDLINLLGKSSLEVEALEPRITYDKFNQTTSISTPSFKNVRIRGSVNHRSKNIEWSQIYLDLVFNEKWGEIHSAVDEFGNRHPITKIDTDVDCSGYGCKLTETIGVNVTKSFLKKHRQGFEIKLYGKQTKVVKVAAPVIASYLTGLDLALN